MGVRVRVPPSAPAKHMRNFVLDWHELQIRYSPSFITTLALTREGKPVIGNGLGDHQTPVHIRSMSAVFGRALLPFFPIKAIEWPWKLTWITA